MVGLLSAMNRKLLRDLWRLRAQALAIALVIASGAALLITSLTTEEALRETTDAYYERNRLANVFAGLTRAPQRLIHRIETIPGVRQAETRIVDLATVDFADFPEPVTARIVSLPAQGDPALNRIVLRRGRLPVQGREDEAILGERFAQAHGIALGGTVSVLMEGRKREVTVVGIALSPEFIYLIGPGAIMPDDERYGVLWMNREVMEVAYDMKDAFNEVSLTLTRGADPDPVIDALDTLLARYGGAGAYGRDLQFSNRFVQNEIEQQHTMAITLPAIFMAVAAFLTNMIMGRVIMMEREEIGLFKAFGYSTAAVGWHYLKMVLAITGLGILVGAAVGSWLGRFNMTLYAEVFQFPFLVYRPGPQAYAIAALVCLAATVAGSAVALRRAILLPPAEAMRPPAPPVYKRSRFSTSALARWMDEPTRMILRRLARWPLQTGFSLLGIALSLAVLVLAMQWGDSVDKMVEDQFYRANHQDATVSLFEAAPLRVLNDAAALPGVIVAEGQRGVTARIRFRNISRRQGIIGQMDGATLSPLHDANKGPLPVPKGGVAISTTMADILGVRRGDTVTLEILEGRRPVVQIPVVETFETYIDTPIVMHLDTLSDLMLESPRINTILVRVDPALKAEFLAALKETPKIGSVGFRQAVIDMFYATVDRNLNIFIGIFTVFSCTLAFGVIYNTLRIALAERSRELATLRVLGFGRGEISYILLGETGILAVAAVPVGILCGAILSWYIAEQFATELFRIPLIIRHETAGLATVIILATVAVCALIVRRRLDNLDLIAVLKTRE